MFSNDFRPISFFLFPGLVFGVRAQLWELYVTDRPRGVRILSQESQGPVSGPSRGNQCHLSIASNPKAVMLKLFVVLQVALYCKDRLLNRTLKSFRGASAELVFGQL